MGRDKLSLRFNGRTLLESAVSRFSGVFEDVFLSVADEGKYPFIGARRVVDIHPGAGPLSGLHAALSCLPGDGVFIVAGDLPYSCPHAAMLIAGLCGGHGACAIRLPDGRVEPLFGYYRKAALPFCEMALASGDYRMSAILHSAGARFVGPAELGGLWDDRIILNVNEPGVLG